MGLSFAIIAIPVQSPSDFLNLKYSKLKPNLVKIEKAVTIEVDESASPLFYKFSEIKKHESLKVAGAVEISQPLSSEEKDAYFQVGIIYEGDYKPGWLVRKILPEWLLTVMSLNDQYGLSAVDFNHFQKETGFKEKTDNVRDIELNFVQVRQISDDGQFAADFKLRDKKVLGLWLRSDGDDHRGKFTVVVSKLEIH